MRGNVVGDCLVITSYDTLRNDVDFLGGFTYDYCVLDEGHVIKNAKSKTTMAIKTIKANHRLILSGTPIQVLVLRDGLCCICSRALSCG